MAQIDGAKAARYHTTSMLIPSLMQVRDEIAKIPFGQTKSLRQIRAELAEEAGAGVTCPMVAGIAWRVAAEAAEEDVAEGVADVTPWWRVTADGKPNPRLPGGAAGHRERLRAEGVEL